LVTQPIDEQTLDRVAQLAQLSVPNEQKPSLKQAMNDVLNLVASLQDVSTDDVEPMAHPLSISQPLRSDSVTDVDRSKIISINAPAVKENCFLVPKVIE
jgi:aspartyl-tRNA(Asn)/glutamyl-tRNA(Gln) amidotransferase subunit C